ncbi:MAG: ATP-dependent zinc metalloprotease FtsH [Caldilineaceae bacterium]|nr:ATP-dependent zinc metalloprotease FtsH [Caldilineaceae bacterium]
MVLTPRTLALAAAGLVVASILIYVVVRQFRPGPEFTSLDTIAAALQAGDVTSMLVGADRVEVQLKDGTSTTALKETRISFLETLADLGLSAETLAGVDIRIAQPGFWSRTGPVLLGLLPLLLIGAFFFFMLRQAQAFGSQTFNFGRNKARMMEGENVSVAFSDVAGNEEAKFELEEVVEFLQTPERFLALGARIPKGVLLIGPPGTGKTLMAKAVAGEAEVPFFNISGSEFVEMFVGVGARRVRDLFSQAVKNAPCIIFVDEIDAVGRRRGAGMGGSHDEREQTLNQILVEMDGFDTSTEVIVMAATNRPDILDPALLRPGRFDRRVTMDMPDMKGRRAILDVHVKGKPLDEDVELDTVARHSAGFVGADIENLVNEAAIYAARHNRRTIVMEDFEEAIERVRVGPERKSRQVSDREREILAYHHAGHALVMHYLPEHDPVHRITIVPRGRKGGYSHSLPENEMHLYNTERINAMLSATLAGRLAEQQHFGEVTTEATDDLDRVTRLARTMITQWGMSPELGPIQYGQREEMVFLGSEITEYRNYGEKTAEEIDNAVRKVVTEASDRAQALLAEHAEELDRLAVFLLARETVEAADLEAILSGELMADMVTDEPAAVGQVEPETPPDQAHAAESGDAKDKGANIGGTVPNPI